MVRDQWHTSGLVWGALIVGGVWMLMIGLHRGEASFVKYLELSQNRDRLEQEIAKLQKEIDLTEQEVHRIRTSSDYARKVLQDKYNFLGENESMVLVPDEFSANQ